MKEQVENAKRASFAALTKLGKQLLFRKQAKKKN